MARSRTVQDDFPPTQVADGAPLIRVHDLTKSFGKKTVVDRLSMTIEPGELYGFLGPNGSGKTTAIRMMCGLVPPTSGSGRFMGFDIVKQSAKIKPLLGYMTQHFSLYTDLTVRENLEFTARLFGIRDVRGRVNELVKQFAFDADGRDRQIVGTMSGGWKQRLALACAMAHRPRVLLLDEPTAGVDPKARRDFWHQIHLLAAEGLTVLVSTHYMDEAERCHRLAYISYGKLLTAGTMREVIDQSKLRTWEVTGTHLDRVIALTAQDEADWMAVPFGAAVHVSSDTRSDFPQWLQQHAQGQAWQAQEIPTGLEDVFIHLSRHANSD